MTDDELTERSARAMGFRYHVGRDNIVWVQDYYPPEVYPRTAPWRPLLDRGQALELVERLQLSMRYTRSGVWYVETPATPYYRAIANNDLRRAIVTCAALLAK